MDISAYNRRTRQHAELLLAAFRRRDAGVLESLTGTAGGDVAPLLEVLGMKVRVIENPAPGCSVAGSSDHRTQTVSIVRASRGRMRFTALHEAGHLLGHDDDAFQDALYAHAKTSDRQVEEDACDAFAAMLLLPDVHVDETLTRHGLTARGLADLITTGRASTEACAVAVAQRLASPGYVVVVDGDGRTRFAARSGDTLPIRRGADQTASDLRAVIGAAAPLRDRGTLQYASGASTHELYLDACTHDGLVLVVACESDPDWPQLQTPVAPKRAAGGIDGFCPGCGVDFTSWQRCSGCGEPRHDACGGCACETRPARGERMCQGGCFTVQPPAAFDGSSAICRSCAG